MPRYAVIDLGTNTFHLLVVEPREEGGFRELLRDRRFIKLAENGIATIGAAPMARALETIEAFAQILVREEVSRVKAFGTAALRTASNGAEFIREVFQRTGLQIDLIDGAEEARLIHLGVAQAVPFGAETYCIMDIGGGSVEFILANDRAVFWAQSFPIGVAVLFRNFHHSDPISPSEIQAVENYLENILAPLFQALSRFPTQVLVGASGTFDVLEDFLVREKAHPAHSRLDPELFFPFYHQVVPTTLQQRRAIAGMPADRVDMIVVALVLVDFILKKLSCREILISNYAMKEGMLEELILENRV